MKAEGVLKPFQWGPRTARMPMSSSLSLNGADSKKQSLSGWIDRLADTAHYFESSSNKSRTRLSVMFGEGTGAKAPEKSALSESVKEAPAEQFDLVIVGAGPAGISAAIYAVRRKLKTLLIDKAPGLGGYVAKTSVIENYPAEYSVTGQTLAAKYQARLDRLNLPESGLSGLLTVRLSQAVGKVSPLESGGFQIKLENQPQWIQSRAVIIASGVNRKKVPIKGFQELLNKGVSMCTICDGPLYRGKDVAVIGHNQAAVDAGLYMATLANKVYFVSGKNIEATPETVAALRQHPKVAQVFENADVTEFSGTDRLSAMVIKAKSQPLQTVAVQGAFLETDLVSAAKFATGAVALDEQGQVIVDDNLSAGLPGLYAAGDVTQVKYKQITIAEGQGANAALRAAEYLQGEDIKADYGKNTTRRSPSNA